MTYYIRNNCRLCLSDDVEKCFELTPTPPANEMVSVPMKQQVYPLYLNYCNNCSHVQLPVVVNPNILFSHYTYTSGINQTFINHLKDLADKCIYSFDLKENNLIAEIGSNDGTLLRFFKERGMRIIGIDPAKNIAEQANKDGLDTICGFFDTKIAKNIVKSHGKAKLIVANNVFAHADDLQEIAEGVKILLDKDGIFVFEVSYLREVIDKNLFDTIYHEHLSYHHLGPLEKFFNRLGLKLFHAERISTQGGSIRGYVSLTNREKTYELDLFLKHEERLGLNNISAIKNLELKINNLKNTLLPLLKDLKSKRKSIAGYGIPAKATTLMYHFGFGTDILDYIVDDSKLKQGLYSPGKHVPVFPVSKIYSEDPDYVLILVWNFAESIIKTNKEFKGKWIIPIPEVKIV